MSNLPNPSNSYAVQDLKAEIIQLELMISQSRNMVLRMEALIEINLKRMRQADEADKSVH